MKPIKPHIRIFTEDGSPILQIDTYELVDFIQDYLLDECSIDYRTLYVINPELNKTNGESYNLIISEKHSVEQVEFAISKLDDKKLEEIIKFQKTQANGKFYCPCCGYNSLDEPPTATYDVCEICCWEDDPIQFDDINYKGGANRVSLVQGQKYFEKIGASEKRLIKYVRKPNDEEVRNPNWKKY